MIKKKITVFNELKKYKNPLKNPCIMLIIGGLGAGKSNLILNIAEILNNNFHSAYYFTPNGKLDQTLKGNLSDDIEIINSSAELMEMLENWRSSQENREENKKKLLKGFLVIDDSITDKSIFPAGQQKTPLTKELVSARHLKLSSIIVCHRFTQCPAVLRDISRFIFIFPLTKKHLELISKETQFEPELVLQIYDEYIKDRHDFIVLDQSDRKIYYKFDKEVFSQF